MLLLNVLLLDVSRNLGTCLLVNAFSAGPLDAMMALHAAYQHVEHPRLHGSTYMLTSAPEIV